MWDAASRDCVAESVADGLEKDADEVGESAEWLVFVPYLFEQMFLAFYEEKLEEPEEEHSKDWCKGCKNDCIEGWTVHLSPGC